MTPPPDSTGQQPFSLNGRHALVTGGASGIGEATAKELVRAGAFVWIADINRPAADALAHSIGSSRALTVDVTNPESIAAACSQLTRCQSVDCPLTGRVIWAPRSKPRARAVASERLARDRARRP